MSDVSAERHNELGQPIGPAVDLELPVAVPSRDPLVGNFVTVVALDADAHADALFEAYSAAHDDGDWTYLPFGPFPQFDEFLAWMSQAEPSPDPLFVTILVDGVPVGVASYLRIAPAVASIEVGSIHFSRRLQRTPAATEAMWLMMREAFALGYRRYEWKCDHLNAPSRAAAVRLGFRFEGTFRKATIYKGRSRDTAWFSIVDDEWPAIDAEFRRWLDPSNFDEHGAQRTRLAMPR